MIIDVERLPEEGLEVCKEFEFFSMDLVDENAVFLKPVSTKIHVRPIGEEEVLVKGTISTRLSFVCSRCLSPFEFPIDSQFDLVFFPEELDVMKEELDSDDMNLYFYHSRKIDLNEVVLEQLNLTFPYKPLCKEDCQGICPVCGKIVREGQCSCLRNESDPRLDKLKNFLRVKR